MSTSLNMSLILYGVIFWIFAITATGIKATGSHKARRELFVIIKMIPAMSAMIFIFLSMPLVALFYILLAIALLFCGFGDVGMEYKFFIGIGLFLIAQIIYIINFFWQSFLLGLSLIPLLMFGGCFFTLLVFIFFYRRYLLSSSQEIHPSILKGGVFYFIMLSLMLSTSLLLWLTSGAVQGYLPTIGGVLFVISDSLIGVRELHHHFQNEELFILPTYYMAIFLLSFGVLIY